MPTGQDLEAQPKPAPRRARIAAYLAVALGLLLLARSIALAVLGRVHLFNALAFGLPFALVMFLEAMALLGRSRASYVILAGASAILFAARVRLMANVSKLMSWGLWATMVRPGLVVYILAIVEIVVCILLLASLFSRQVLGFVWTPPSSDGGEGGGGAGGGGGRKATTAPDPGPGASAPASDKRSSSRRAARSRRSRRAERKPPDPGAPGAPQ